MTTINGEKQILIECPFGCGQEIHYCFLVTGRHVCGKNVDSKTKKELNAVFKDFQFNVNEILEQFKLRRKMLN